MGVALPCWHSFNWLTCFILMKLLNSIAPNQLFFPISSFWLRLLETKLITRQNITPLYYMTGMTQCTSLGWNALISQPNREVFIGNYKAVTSLCFSNGAQDNSSHLKVTGGINCFLKIRLTKTDEKLWWELTFLSSHTDGDTTRLRLC